MTVSLRPLVGAEVTDFLRRSRAAHIAERVASGDDAESAARAADQQLAGLFPDGSPRSGHRLYRVISVGEDIGWLWVGEASPDKPSAWWIWDILIDEAHRGKGLGRAAMLLGEQAARDNGAQELGLNVFADNLVARSLYESLGYSVVSIRMSKAL